MKITSLPIKLNISIKILYPGIFLDFFSLKNEKPYVAQIILKKRKTNEVTSFKWKCEAQWL